MSEETKKSYGTWEEAVEELKRNLQAAMQTGMTEMQAKLQAEMNESFSNFIEVASEKVMKELEPTIDVKIDQVIAEKVANASINKIDEEVLPGVWNAIQRVEKQNLEQAERVILLDSKFDEFARKAKEEVDVFYLEKFRTEVMPGVNTFLDPFRESLHQDKEDIKSILNESMKWKKL